MGSSVPLQHLVVLFGVLLILGIALTIPLFDFDYQKFVRSSLCIKIIFWVPIFLVFLGVLYASNLERVAVLACLVLAALAEFLRVVIRKKNKTFFMAYFLFFALGLAHFFVLGNSYQAEFVNLLVTLCFVTVLSDVVAFFLGNYLGKHKLPTGLNNKKSWEGVAGQLVGALIGVLLVNVFITPVVSIWLFIPLGLGSAIGDLANSFAKRKADIKDWSQAIPGHGGFIDRLSSMAGSVALMFYYLKITGLG
jgi:phosphatidate cytidylyltransferase